MRKNSADWHVGLIVIDPHTPKDCDELRIEVPEGSYTLDYAEHIAQAILDFVEQQRKRIAELEGGN